MLQDTAPFSIFGPIYYVGNSKDSSHLIDTGDGLILIDTPRDADSAIAIRASMESLGFRVQDIKYIIVTHGHFDHWEGVPMLVEWSGAETFMSRVDLQLKPGFRVDHPLEDGDVIRLGDIEILCLFTPGHTAGTFSFFFHVEENGKRYRAGMLGGAGINQMSKDYLDRHGLSYTQRDDFYRTLERLKQEQVDIVLGNHPGQSKTLQKQARKLAGEPMPFVDSSEWLPYLERLRTKMDQMIREGR